ncbi:MAG: lysylphosphatidylglycerol synthase transmembrane domain-containing protein [Phocaeicola sp.]
MKSNYRNLFLFFGLAAILIMVFTFDMDYAELWENLCTAGVRLPMVVGLWLFIYLFNALSWYFIIQNGESKPVPFWRVYKYTITGFSLNYATPMGLMGGEPYRILELTPYVGGERATSSVILYAMTHIFTHICFWFFSIFLYCAYYTVTFEMGILLSVVGFCCLVAIYFFMKGYKKGMALKTLLFLCRLPYIKRWAIGFVEKKRESLQQIDQQISQLHGQRKQTFLLSFSLEFVGRILGCLEIYFLLNILTYQVSFPDCILIMAFSSLFSNLLFFSPMQLGAREGGLALAVGGLAIPMALGIYLGLLTRVRELIWIAIGVLLMKIGNKPVESTV